MTSVHFYLKLNVLASKYPLLGVLDGACFLLIVKKC